MVNKTVVGFLILAILSASFYVVLPDNVRIDVENTRTKYSVDVDGSWELAATEYFNLFDGTAKMRAKNRTITQSVSDNIITMVRTSNYKDNITTIQTYIFNGSTDNVESFPTSHVAQCINCLGKIVHFEYRDILYTGETKVIASPFEFGHNMKLEWQDGAYLTKVYQQSTVADKIIIRYRPEDNDETYNIKLVDPEPRDIIDSKEYQYIYINYTDVTSMPPNCFGGIKYEYTINVTEKIPVYKEKENCCSSLNKTCTPCKTTICSYDCYMKKVIDHYENKTIQEKKTGVSCRIGVIVGNETYIDKQGINVNDKTNTLNEWSVQIGDRNFEEFGTCRDFEIEKGVCKENDLI